jgi:hypothetical protein
LCISLFIIKCCQAVWRKITCLKDKNFSSMLYFVLFSLKIRLLSPEFFPTVRRKGLCKVCWQTALWWIWPVKANTCFLIFLPVPQFFIVCHTVPWIYCLWNLRYISTMALRRKLHDDDLESKLICDMDSD